METEQIRDCGGDTGAEVRRLEGASAAADGRLSEDEKIEKFFALIRSYKEARDRQRSERERSYAKQEFEYGWSENDESWKRKEKKMKLGDREQPSWTPAFKWEDFTQNEKAGVDLRRPLLIFPAPNFKGSSRSGNMHGDVKDPPPVPADVDGGGLDLKLRL